MTDSHGYTAVVVCVLVWFATCNVFNWTCTIITAQHHDDSHNSTLSGLKAAWTQLAASSCLGAAYIAAFGKDDNNESVPRPVFALLRLMRRRIKILLPLSLGLIAANGAMMVGLAHCSIALFQTVKASSPVITVTVCVFALRLQYSLATYVSLLPIVVGFSMAALSEDNVHSDHTGLLLCLASAGFQVFVNLKNKVLLTDPVNEMAAAGGTKANYQKPLRPEELQFAVTITACCAMFCIIVPMQWAELAVPSLRPKVPEAKWSGSLLDQKNLMLLVINGILYHIEHVMAILTNSKVPRLTFSVIDTLRRLSIVISSFVISGRIPSVQSWLGSLIVMVGCICFAVAQHAKPRQNPKGKTLST
jgi:solute carrier family 35 protein E1